MPTSSKKRSPPQRSPLFESRPKKERFGGPDSYDLPKPAARSFAIGSGVRFDYEQQQILDEQRARREAALQQKQDALLQQLQQQQQEKGQKSKPQELLMLELSAVRMRSSSPPASSSPNRDPHKAIEVPVRAANFSTKELRFAWQQTERLQQTREQRMKQFIEKARQQSTTPPPVIKTKKTNSSAAGDGLFKQKKGGAHMSEPRYLQPPLPEHLYREPVRMDLDVERGRRAIEPRALTPAIRADVGSGAGGGEGDSWLTKTASKNKNKKMDDDESEETKRSKAAAEAMNTIAHFVRFSKGGDFSLGSERCFLPPAATRSPGAIYEPKFDAVRAKTPTPIIRPLSESAAAAAAGKNGQGDDAAISSRGLMSTRKDGARASGGATDESIAETSTRAMQQLDKLLPRSPTPIVSLKAPISANMPFSYNMANIHNSRSMRALLCDPDSIPPAVRKICPLLQNDGGHSGTALLSSPSSASAPKSSNQRRRKVLKSVEKKDGDPSSSLSQIRDNDIASTPGKEDEQQQQQQQQSSKRRRFESSLALLESGILSPFCRRSPHSMARFALNCPKMNFGGSSSDTTTTTTNDWAHSSGIMNNTNSSSVLNKKSEQQRHYSTVTTTTTPASTIPVETAFSSPLPVWSYAHKKASDHPRSGVPLAVLLKKKKLESNTVFSSSGVKFDHEMRGVSEGRLKRLEREGGDDSR